MPLIVAHRGASADAPENTLAAFRLAFEQGADAIEGDFRLSADGEVVCCHDQTTGARGDRNLDIARGTLAEVRTVDVGRWKSPQFAGERIPTLGEFLAVVPAGKRAFIELKTGPQIVPAVRKIIEAGPVPADRLAIIAFDANTVAACRQAMPAITCNWLVDYEQDEAGRLTPSHETILQTLRASRASGLGTENAAAAVPPEFVRQLREGGYGFHVWTIDTAADADAFRALGVDSMTTNKPAWLREHLRV